MARTHATSEHVSETIKDLETAKAATKEISIHMEANPANADEVARLRDRIAELEGREAIRRVPPIPEDLSTLPKHHEVLDPETGAPKYGVYYMTTRGNVAINW